MRLNVSLPARVMTHFFRIKDLSTQKEDRYKRYGVGKHFLSSFWENQKFSSPITFWSRNRLITTARMNNSCLCSFCSSDAKNSGFRRAIGTNDTPLNSIFSLVSGKIKISGFRSHFGLKIDRSSEQNESNSSFLSANWMQNDQISGIQPVERANHRWLWIGTSFCSFLISLAVLIVGKQKIISNLNSRNGYYPFKWLLRADFNHRA